MDKYYVYAHAKPDGEVFYVGKGSGKRLFHTGNRSAFWKRITEKYDYTVFLLEEGLSESRAYKQEMFWIKHYKKIGQCVANFTLGGDGVRVEKRWWNEKISESLKGKQPAKGMNSKSFKNCVSKSNLIKMYIRDRMSSVEIAKSVGVSYTTICSRLVQYGLAVRDAGRSKRAVICNSDGKEFESISDAAMFYGLRRELISKVLSGKYKTTGGKSFSYRGQIK